MGEQHPPSDLDIALLSSHSWMAVAVLHDVSCYIIYFKMDRLSKRFDWYIRFICLQRRQLLGKIPSAREVLYCIRLNNYQNTRSFLCSSNARLVTIVFYRYNTNPLHLHWKALSFLEMGTLASLVRLVLSVAAVREVWCVDLVLASAKMMKL